MSAFTIDEGKRMKELLDVLRRPEAGDAGAGAGSGGAGAAADGSSDGGAGAGAGAGEGVSDPSAVITAKEEAFDELLILIETIDNSRGGCHARGPKACAGGGGVGPGRRGRVIPERSAPSRQIAAGPPLPPPSPTHPTTPTLLQTW
jgi:hypothetical protein